ncbi:MAG: hypothetical protein DRQ88_05795 [Epsilonproteobacteria bacterium]|nr:MAG: hypothetical protein DRQ89_06970 [Campylobacterota bacterium]RLA66725.1 MAG: hypothetical protein DRQ88_05795 [Campylobacterota bacterium]
MKKIIFILIFFSVTPLSASDNITKMLLRDFKTEKKGPEIVKLKQKALKYSGKAVPALVEVMKNGKYPERNRWIATFLLANIMGPKSASFLAKFSKHPNWVLRMASLKALLSLKEKNIGPVYADALKDKSLIVRIQALENIGRLQLDKYAPLVWAMLYDDRNYYSSKSHGKKRSDIIKKVITTIGDLKFNKAEEALLTMIQKKKYDDIFEEMDYSLSKILGKKSPVGSRRVKRYYWKRIGMAHIKI